MGIEDANVSDLRITRPNRTGPYGDEVGDPTEIAAELAALFVPEDKIFRRTDGREVVSFGQFFIDPIRDTAGNPVAIHPGDFAEWTDLFGETREPQEIISVAPTADCAGKLDVVTFRIGQASAAGV